MKNIREKNGTAIKVIKSFILAGSGLENIGPQAKNYFWPFYFIKTVKIMKKQLGDLIPDPFPH